MAQQSRSNLVADLAATKSSLDTAIDADITTNAGNAITGNKLNSRFKDIVEQLLNTDELIKDIVDSTFNITTDDLDDISEGTTNKHFTATEKTKLSGVTTAATANVQQAAEADLGSATTIGANTGTAGAGLSLIGDTSTTDQSTALMNDLAALQEDNAALNSKVNALLAKLRTANIIST